MVTERPQGISPTEDFALADDGPHTSQDHEGYAPTESAGRDSDSGGESVTEYTLTRDEQKG